MILHGLAIRSERKRESEPSHPVQEENVFTIAQIIGVVCGLMGLWINFNFFLRQHQIGEAVVLLPLYILILLPYGLVVLYWLSMRRKVPFSQWYDEKQWRDVARAGLFLFNKRFGIFWFPHYVFLILTLFSASTLYLFRHPE